MRIAIDNGPLTSGHSIRGIGVHTRELGEELKKLITKELQIEFVDFTKIDLSRYDIVHYPYFHPFFITLPFVKPAGKIVVTIHDLIPLIYPEHYPPGLKGNLRFLIQKFLLKNVDAIITISETSKKDICRFLSVQPDKVHVVYLAPRKIFKKLSRGAGSGFAREIKKRYGLPERFVLYVGDVNYNKNIPALIKTCKLAKIPLVICGKQAQEIEEQGRGLDVLTGPSDWIRFLFDLPHPELAHFEEMIGAFRTGHQIVRLGFVSDRDLVAIYNLASVYCQPSLYEGFGLPVLEAFACGTPVVASKTQALVEVGGDGALYADANDSNDIAKKILEVVNKPDIKNILVKNGTKIVKKFSWDKTAGETLNVYRKVYESK